MTVIYLSPRDDVGDTLIQAVDGQHGWSVTIPCVRLWEQDATAALASGAPGLLALLPLMHGAKEDLVEQAIRALIAQVAPPVQGELLVALGSLRLQRLHQAVLTAADLTEVEHLLNEAAGM